MPIMKSRVLVLLLVGVLFRVSAAESSSLRYNRDIRPLLSDNCFQCHGPDKAQRKAKLRLDVRDAALEQGAFVPGKPDESELVKRIFTEDPDDRMPPAEIHKILTTEEKERLRQWIKEGATYEAHWAYLPIQRPPVPNIQGAGSLRNPIDAFLLERLHAVGLDPAPEAPRATLLRRLSLDLTGLPPSAAEVDAFVEDDRPDAYERQVERLLASPHFGERMAVPWLDAVRFTDTVGYHGDQNQRIFPYRDYVIAAFNQNKGFDQFTIEQIAGDLLPSPTVEQQVATGFNRLNMMTREGGAQPKEYLAKYQADRVRTVATTWLGATMACAECHDHKFDPFTTRDFYSMEAFFADVKQWGVYNDYDYTPNPDLKGWSNDHPFPPEIQVESPYLKKRAARLAAKEQQLSRDIARRLLEEPDTRGAVEIWKADAREFLQKHPEGWSSLRPSEIQSKEGDKNLPADHAEVLSDDSIRLKTDRVATDRFSVVLPSTWLAALRIELMPPAPGERLFRTDRKTTTVQFSASLRHHGTADVEPLRFAFADADQKEPRYANGDEIIGVQGGWKLSSPSTSASQSPIAIWILEKPRRASAGDVLTLTLPNNVAARVRFSLSPFAVEPSRWSAAMAEFSSAIQSRARRADELVSAWYERSTGHDRSGLEKLRAVDRKLRECRDGLAWTMVTVATNAPVTRVLPRGNWMDESGPIVEPATPSFLPTLASVGGYKEGQGDSDPEHSPEPRRLNRLDLAHWLVSRENPLTARNFVNRLWGQFFGTAISARIEDLGLQGEWPTHPELLDWLAAEFMEPQVNPNPSGRYEIPHAWDIKHMVRLIVHSAAYRRDSTSSERAREVDPENKLLSHQSPRRLEAEFVRDNALSIAGLINLDVGGPSAFPYQPPGYYANLQFPDRDYVPDRDELQYRRGVYMHWQRTFLHPMLANFDAQSREECVASRLPSNTPQQALTLLNDPTFVEAARALATRVLALSTDDRVRIRELFRTAVLRDPSSAECGSLLEHIAVQRKLYRDQTEDARKLVGIGVSSAPAGVEIEELAAWTNVARVILNLHETITRY